MLTIAGFSDLILCLLHEIIVQMAGLGRSVQGALAEARRRGYAESVEQADNAVRFMVK